MSSILQGFLHVLHPFHFPFLLLGVVGGMIVGSMPGLSGSVGIILLLPLTYQLDPATAMVMLCGMFCGSMYGGSISAILLSIPGTPSAAATVFDGHPLAQKGEAGKAIGVATIASAFGGIFSLVCLMFLAPPLARFALKFGPEEYFALVLFGLTIIASVEKSLVKGLIAGFIGLLVAVVGIDPITGYARFSFNIPNLMTGFPLLAVLTGLFAISEIFIQLERIGKKKIIIAAHQIKNVLPSLADLKKLAGVILSSSFIGTIIGVIPGTGGTIAAFMAYNEAKRWSKDPESFGKGALAGVAAPEAANNGTTGGALVPLLTLGIPGDVITAVMLGALMLIGVRPGPALFKDHPEIVNAIYAGLLVANVLFLLLGLLGVKLFPKVLLLPDPMLFAVIFALCFIGAFSISNSTYDMLIALIFGVFGYVMRKNGIAAAPLVLGVVLGPIAEEELGRALMIAHGDWTVLFKSPLALFFYGLAFFSVSYSLKRQFSTHRSAT